MSLVADRLVMSACAGQLSMNNSTFHFLSFHFYVERHDPLFKQFASRAFVGLVGEREALDIFEAVQV